MTGLPDPGSPTSASVRNPRRLSDPETELNFRDT